MADWFAQNAPTQSGDWFASNAPQAKEPFSDYKSKSLIEQTGEAAKQLGSSITGVVTGIPDAVREVANFLRNPNEWARKHFDPSQANAGPGAMGSAPLQEAQGALLNAGAAAVGPQVAEAAGGAVKRGAGAALDVATDPRFVQGLEHSSYAVMTGGAAHGSPLTVAGGAAARAGAGILRKIGERRASAPAPIVEAPSAPAPEAYYRGQSVEVQPEAPVLQDPNFFPNYPAKPAPPEVAPQPAPAPVQQPVATVQPPAVEAPRATPKRVPKAKVTEIPKRPDAEAIAQQMRDAMAESGTLPESPPDETVQTTQRGHEAEARNTKAEKVAKYLHDNGIASTDVGELNVDEPGVPLDWKRVFQMAGEYEPGHFSGNAAPSIEQTIIKLRNLEKPTPGPRPVKVRRR